MVIFFQRSFSSSEIFLVDAALPSDGMFTAEWSVTPPMSAAALPLAPVRSSVFDPKHVLDGVYDARLARAPLAADVLEVLPPVFFLQPRVALFEERGR
jgi:hypothetical protein